MQKVVALIQFRKEMTREEAMRYWRDVHGPIASKVPGVKKYVQNHSTSALQGELAFDGIAELWFDSPEALQSALAAPEWQATMADAANFADMEKTWVALVDEISVV